MPRDLATLQRLRAVICDCVLGYHRAAVRARSPEIKSALLSLALAREAMLERLHERIGGRDGMIVFEGTAGGSLDGFRLVVASFLWGSDRAIVRQMRQAESRLSGKVERALTTEALSAEDIELIAELSATLKQEQGVLAVIAERAL